MEKKAPISIIDPVQRAQQNLDKKTALGKADAVPKEKSMSSPRKVERVVKETRPVIIDIGTGYCKAGYGGQPRPSYVISSTVGKHLQKTVKTGDNRKESFVGQERINAKVPLKLYNPLRHGIVVDWDCIQDIWEYIFYKEMKIPPEEHAVLVSDPPLSPTTNREKYAEMIFETFCSPAMHISYQSRLSMYSYGNTSGLVVECGHGVSYVVPIYDGYTMPNITGRVDYGGEDITKYLMNLLNETGNKFKEEHLQIIEDMKIKCCYISSDLDYEIDLPLSEYRADLELPDGHLITIGKERFLCSEALFKPSLIGSNQLGLHSLTMSCINKCDDMLKKIMMNNILLCGGSTMLEGFPGRFQKELNNLSPQDKLLTTASPERKYSVWIGGSILASLKSFQQLWVFKREYDEEGPQMVYRKCF